MIVVRELFYARPGQASKLAKLFREAMDELYPSHDHNVRVMTDLITEFNKVVIETELDNLAAFEARMQEYRQNSALRSKLANYLVMYQEGRREVYEIVE